MSSIVIDVLYVKLIEKTIKRKLDQVDIECIYYGEPLFVQNPNGLWMSFIVPLYRLPDDLMSKNLDVHALKESYENASFFQYAFQPDPVMSLKHG